MIPQRFSGCWGLKSGLFSLAAGVAACGGDILPGDPDFVLRDEDGVTIAENAGLYVADTLAWSIDTTDVVKIGLVEGPEEYVFGRIGGLLLTPEGNILVGDALADEIRLFDEWGQFVRKLGRAGEGPGEFNGMNQVRGLAGDSVAVISGQRVDLLDPSLRFVRRYRPNLTETVAAQGRTADKLEGMFADGSPLMSDFLSVCRSGTGEMCIDSILFHRTDESGAIQARFGRFVWARNESYRVDQGFSTSWSEPHPQAFWTAHGDRFYYGDAQRFEILVYRFDGSLERRIRVNEGPPRYGREDVYPSGSPPEPFGDPRIDQAQQVYYDARQKAELPDTLPFFSDMIVDEEGNIWIREYRPPGGLHPAPRWWIFDPEGRLRWGLRSPDGLIRVRRPVRNLDPYIGSDRIVTSVRGEYGVESVVVYSLRKR